MPRICSLLWLALVLNLHAQWIPPQALRSVPVREDCRLTRGGVGASIQPTIFYPQGIIFICPSRCLAIDQIHPGASRFFLVHEYGHLALRTREEAAADEWAARQLGSIPEGRKVLRAVLLHFIDEGKRFDPLYGSAMERALRIAQVAGIAEKERPDPLRRYEKIKDVGRSQAISLRVPNGYFNAAQMTVFVDGQAVGFLSNLDRPFPLKLPLLEEGEHEIQLTDVWLYHREPDGRKSEIARHLSADAGFRWSGKKRLVLTLKFEEGELSFTAKEE